jgi:hypothetical protein
MGGELDLDDIDAHVPNTGLNSRDGEDKDANEIEDGDIFPDWPIPDILAHVLTHDNSTESHGDQLSAMLFNVVKMMYYTGLFRVKKGVLGPDHKAMAGWLKTIQALLAADHSRTVSATAKLRLQAAGGGTAPTTRGAKTTIKIRGNPPL